MTQDLNRYHRQMLLPGIGEQGQKKLLGSTALVIGCGALGTVIANTLARSGVGHLIIADRDFIEITNLQRQVLFDEDDIDAGVPKAVAAKQKIHKINSQVAVTAVVDDVNHTNIEKLVATACGGESGGGGRCGVIVDGVDNFETRFLVNDAAVKLGTPYVYGGAVGTVGMYFAICPHSPDGDLPWEKAGRATPCLRCIFEQVPPPGMNPTCDTAGILATTPAIIASHQANEAIKILTGNWEAVNPTMLSIDTWHNTVRQFKVAGAYDAGDCSCCKQRRFEYLDGKFGSSTTTLCGRNAVQLSQKDAPDGIGKLDFDQIAGRLRPHGRVRANKFMLRADITDNGEAYELTLFTDGRAIIKGTTKPQTARSIYARYVGA